MIRYMSVRVEVAVEVEPGEERDIGQRLATEASDAVCHYIERFDLAPDSRVVARNPQHAATVVRRP